MNLKLHAAIILALFAAITTASATVFMAFTSWDELIGKSTDIVIARCTKPHQDRFVLNHMLHAEIDVNMVLKGGTQVGAHRMVSEYPLKDGEQFLLIGYYQVTDSYRGYGALERYRIIPLHGFDLATLAGKPLAEQVQLVLKHRLETINRTQEQLAEEKQRLEQGIKK